MGDVRRGILFVLSGPSGAGKSTLSRRLLDDVEDLEFSVSYTTRPPRPGEIDGEHYQFVDDATFQRMVDEGVFLECARVHGQSYGTGRRVTESRLAEGTDLLLDIDVQGGRQIRESGVDAVLIFILPPDFATLESRLRARSDEDGGDVGDRLSIAASEAAEYSNYDYLVINDDLERAYEELRSLVRSERRRVLRCRGEADKIVARTPRL